MNAWKSNRMARMLAGNPATAIFVLSLIVRLSFIFGTQSWRNIERPESVRVAESLAAGRGFRDPFPVHTGPTAHLAPAYPYFLSLAYRTFDEPARQLVVELATAVTSSAMFAVMPFVSATIGLSSVAGVIGGLIGATVPIRLWVETKGSWETHWLALGLLLMLAAIHRWYIPARKGLGHVAMLGICCGALFLIGPNLLPTIAVWMLLATWLRRKSFRQGATRLVLFGGCVALVVAPWIVRCYRDVGVVGWIRGNLGLELAVSNNADAKPTSAENFDGNVRHPFASPREAMLVSSLGEAEYNRQRLREARTWIRENPGRFSLLTARRIVTFWFPGMNHWAKQATYWFLVVSAFVGVVLSWRSGTQAFLWSALVFLAFPLLYYIVQHDVRYPYPIYPFVLLNAGVTAEYVIVRFRSPSYQPAPERAFSASKSG